MDKEIETCFEVFAERIKKLESILDSIVAVGNNQEKVNEAFQKRNEAGTASIDSILEAYEEQRKLNARFVSNLEHLEFIVRDATLPEIAMRDDDCCKNCVCSRLNKETSQLWCKHNPRGIIVTADTWCRQHERKV